MNNLVLSVNIKLSHIINLFVPEYLNLINLPVYKSVLCIETMLPSYSICSLGTSSHHITSSQVSVSDNLLSKSNELNTLFNFFIVHHI